MLDSHDSGGERFNVTAVVKNQFILLVMVKMPPN